MNRRFKRIISWPGGTMSRRVYVTSAQVLALNNPAVVLLPSPGDKMVHIFKGAVIHKPAGTAYAGIALGEDLAIRYTDVNGLQVGVCETTGFLDQVGALTRYVAPFNAASGVSDQAVVPSEPLLLHMLTGNITTGDSPLICRIFYKTVPTGA